MRAAARLDAHDSLCRQGLCARKIGKNTAHPDETAERRASILRTMSAGQNVDLMEATMLREHVINFLEAAVVLLMVINAFSVATAAYALSLVQRVSRTSSRTASHSLLAPLPRWLRLSRRQQ